MSDDYYVYILWDSGRIARYVGKGTGPRSAHLERLSAAIVRGEEPKRASRVHRRMAAVLLAGGTFTVELLEQGLSQAEAYTLEARTIARYGRETEGGTLWNVLGGGEGFRGILREDWIVVARGVADRKRAAGIDRLAGQKAAATRRAAGTDKLAGIRAAATRRARLGLEALS